MKVRMNEESITAIRKLTDRVQWEIISMLGDKINYINVGQAITVDSSVMKIMDKLALDITEHDFEI